MTTWHQLQKKIESELKPININSRLESHRWLSDAWNVKPNNEQAPKEVEEKINEYISRRLSGEPWPYIIGFSWFMGEKLICHQDAMIPQETTSVVVEEALKLFDSEEQIRVADVGTGNGAIAIALAKKTKWKITGIDSSGQALKIAEKNCDLHKVDVELVCGNIITPLVRIPHLIVSYLPSLDEGKLEIFRNRTLSEIAFMDSNVLKEPQSASFAPDKGNFWIKALLKQGYEWGVPVIIQKMNENAQEMLEYSQSMGWFSGWLTSNPNNQVLITIRNEETFEKLKHRIP